MVEDIMDLSRFQFNEFQLNLSWFTFHEVVDEVISMCQFQAQSRKVKLMKKLAIEDNQLIYSDKKRIKQIITNLITNAIKFT